MGKHFVGDKIEVSKAAFDIFIEISEKLKESFASHAALRAERDEAKRLLKEFEYTSSLGNFSGINISVCVHCGGVNPIHKQVAGRMKDKNLDALIADQGTWGHAPDCKYDALMKA